MQTLTSLVGIAVGLALLALVGLGLYWALAWLLGLVLAMDPSLATTTASVGALCMLAALLVAGRKGSVTAMHADERASVYAAFVVLWTELINEKTFLAGASAPADQGEDAVEIDEALRSLDQRLALWGSGAVLKGQRALHDLRAQGALDSAAARATLTKAVLAIRRELGSGGPGSGQRDLEALLFPSALPSARKAASMVSTPVPDKPARVPACEEPR